MVQDTAANALDSARRIVFKIGSSLLAEDRTGHLRQDWMTGLARDLAEMKADGRDIVLVSSGAIALGADALAPSLRGRHGRPETLGGLQAAAAVGQIRLARAWSTAFESVDLGVGQLLVSLTDFEDRSAYLNARATTEGLLESDIIPVFNENDTVATAEIRFGDNDRLAARVAGLVQADCLVLLSDVDGLYTADPGRDAAARHIAHVDTINDEIMALGGPALAIGIGTGGMASKLEAAKIATDGGTRMIVANGRGAHPVRAVRDGARATLFATLDTPLAVRKRWLRGLSAPRGFLHLDSGAAAAVREGASLLSVGVTDIRGRFDRGDAVALMGPDGETVAQGLVATDSSVARRIMGLTTAEAADVLGYAPRAALVHRDDLVILS